MSLATWWLWRYQAFLDSCGPALQGVAGGSQVYRKSYIHGGVFPSRSKNVVPLGKSLEPSEPFSTGSLRRKIPLVRPRASSGGAGMGSNDEDFLGGGFKLLDAFSSWNWLGSRRQISGDSRWRREDDEGDWKYSPEWWGTQGGGWGRNEGDTVFEMPTSTCNGMVSVTAHPASPPQRTISGQLLSASHAVPSKSNRSFNVDQSYEVLCYEWRVLRFNGTTRQSVAKVVVLRHAEDAEKVVFLQQPNCIAFEYVKSLISSGLAAVSLAGLDLRLVATGIRHMRILCIGLGGGTLPLFLAHNLPGATVDAVEIDPVVISAAVNTMGFPPCRVISRQDTVTSIQGQASAKHNEDLWGNLLQRISIYESDGEDFVWERSQKAEGLYDLVFVDAYDGDDIVPFKFWDRNGHFLSSLSALLNPDHGTVVVNLHTDSAPPSMVERLSGKFGPGYDPSLPQGKRVLEAAVAYRDVLLRARDSWRFEDDDLEIKRFSSEGLAFTVSVSLQGNISLVVSRGASKGLKDTSGVPINENILDEYLMNALVHEVKDLQTSLNVPFDMTKRVSRGFRRL